MSVSIQIITRSFPVVLALVDGLCIYLGSEYNNAGTALFGGGIILLAAIFWYDQMERDDDYRRKYAW